MAVRLAPVGCVDRIPVRGRAGPPPPGLWGFEREALRVDGEGRLATTDHPFPPERGDITVDFAENQIELVTRPRSEASKRLAPSLRRLHRVAYEGIGDELLWPLSVPGRWDEPERLRPAEFGGAAGTGGVPPVQAMAPFPLRAGPAGDNGAALQLFLLERILGSPPAGRALARGPAGAFANRRYMELARNFARYRFLPIFLFSASPVLDRRFAAELARVGGSLFPRHGQGLHAEHGEPPPRASRISPGPKIRRIGSTCASTPSPSTSTSSRPPSRRRADSPPLLRSEGEFYAPVRPKAAFPGSKASLAALRSKGIEYLELRIFDLDPFDPIGIGAEEALWIHLFALACLFMPSPRLGRGVAQEEPLSLAASACSLERAGAASVPPLRLGRRPRRRGSPRGRCRGSRASCLPSTSSLWSHSRDIIAGRRPRTVDRFGELASGDGRGPRGRPRSARGDTGPP